MEELIRLLKEKGWTIGSCESCTGGLFASEITAVSGASKVYKGSLVTYWTQLKENFLSLSPELISERGVVSAEVAKVMAEKARTLLGVDVCVSFTGNAGPGVMEGKPSGLIYSAICIQGRTTIYEDQLKGERNENRLKIVERSAKRCIQKIQEWK